MPSKKRPRTKDLESEKKPPIKKNPKIDKKPCVKEISKPDKKPCKKGSYALVWWMNKAQKDVVETSMLPRNRRSIGNCVKLLWKDVQTGICTKEDAKVVEFYDDPEYLNNLRMDSNGNIRDDQTKMFIEPIVSQNACLQKNKKDITNSIKIVKTNEGHNILNSKELFTIPELPSSVPVTSAVDNCLKTPQSLKTPTVSSVLQERSNNSLPSNFKIINNTNLNVSNSNKSTFMIENLLSESSTSNVVLSNTAESSSPMVLREKVNNKENIIVTQEMVDIGALHTFLPMDVSKDNVEFLRQVLAVLTTAYQSQRKFSSNVAQVSRKIPETFRMNGDDKTALSSDCGIYFRNNVIKAIERDSLDENKEINWKKMLKLSLFEVYGRSLGNYCAIGKQTGSRPGIDANLRNGIRSWISSKISKDISKKAITREINRIISNQRASNESRENRVRPDEITKDGLFLIQRLLRASEKSMDWQETSELQFSNFESALVPPEYLQPDSNKIKISPDYNIYFPVKAYAYVEGRSQINPNSNICEWRKLVKLALRSVYKENLKNFSAKGTTGDRPGIDPQLFHAVYDWANSRSEEPVPSLVYIDHINTFISNSRQSKNKDSCRKKKQLQQNNTNISPHENNTTVSPANNQFITPTVEQTQLNNFQMTPIFPNYGSTITTSNIFNSDWETSLPIDPPSSTAYADNINNSVSNTRKLGNAQGCQIKREGVLQQNSLSISAPKNNTIILPSNDIFTSPIDDETQPSNLQMTSIFSNYGSNIFNLDWETSLPIDPPSSTAYADIINNSVLNTRTLGNAQGCQIKREGVLQQNSLSISAPTNNTTILPSNDILTSSIDDQTFYNDNEANQKFATL